MNTISSLFAAGIEEVRKSWGWFLIFGILLMVLGAACIAKAQTATTFSILALGWVLGISGIVWLLGALQTWTWSGFFLYFAECDPDAGAAAVTMVIAALFIVGGLFRVAGASVIQFPRWDGPCLPDWSRSDLASTFVRLALQPVRTSSA